MAARSLSGCATDGKQINTSWPRLAQSLYSSLLFFPTVCVRECVRPGMCARDDCLHHRVIYYLFIHMKASSSFSFFFFVGRSTRQRRRNISRLIFFFAYTQDIFSPSSFLFIYKSAIRPYPLKWNANRSGSHIYCIQSVKRLTYQ